MDDWKLNALTVVRLQNEHRTFVFLFSYMFSYTVMRVTEGSFLQLRLQSIITH